jgi:hypothetical protein
MDAQGISGVLAIGLGLVASAAGWLLIVTWPYWLDVVAVVGGPLMVFAGIALLRGSGVDHNPQ